LCRSRGRGVGRPTSTLFYIPRTWSGSLSIFLGSLVKGMRARRERPFRSSRRRRPLKRKDAAAGSAAEPQTLDQRVVARDSRALQVIEQAEALADHHEQAAS